MKMSTRRRDLDEPFIDLTNLIDIAFVLVIFLAMLSAERRQSEIKVDLPEATTASIVSEQISLDIIITPEGKFHLNKEIKSKDSKANSEKFDIPVANPDINLLKQAIKKVSGGNASIRVFIRADAKSPHMYFVRVMDALGQLGFKRISVVTLPPQGSK